MDMDMNELLLEKITELTCLVIELSGRVDMLEKRIRENIYYIK